MQKVVWEEEPVVDMYIVAQQGWVTLQPRKSRQARVAQPFQNARLAFYPVNPAVY